MENHAKVHPLWLRATHWINVLAVAVLVTSGWRIYDASPIFAFRIPPGLTLGGWLAGALLWHFAAMWLLAANGVLYLVLNLASGRAGRRFLPLRPRDVLRDLAAALRARLRHDDPWHYNAVQKLAYLFAVLDLIVMVLSGLVVWKSVQFPLLRDLMGGYDNARVVHFVGMALLLGFVVVHMAMALVVPKSLLLITRGR
ncbi:MAG TPA: cytochrome b/b6 domain-containing protein [Rhodocyclaceae bacterium]